MLWDLWFTWLAYFSFSMFLYWMKQQYLSTVTAGKLAAGGRQHNQGLVWGQQKNGAEYQDVNSFMWMYKEEWIGTTSCFHSERETKTSPPTTVSPPFLYFFASFAILFTTQEYTHRSPGGAGWMRAEIQCAHYAVKSILSHHSFPWVAFVLFKCLHGTAWGLQDRCMVQEKCLSKIPLFPGWK